MLLVSERDQSQQSVEEDGQVDGSLKLAKEEETVRAPSRTFSSNNATAPLREYDFDLPVLEESL
jgi:hypothetical protein